MVRKVTPAQLRSLMRQAEQKQRQAVNKYNSEVRKYNAGVKSAVNQYNREVSAHNAKVRSNRQRLQREINSYNSRNSISTRYATSSTSIRRVEETFSYVEAQVDSGQWADPHNLLDLAEGEAAETVGALNGLLEGNRKEDEDFGALAETSLTHELLDINPELQDRWVGALYSLSPRNPDAARHFCTSARELLAAILDEEAPDAAVKKADPNYAKTPNGGVSRRAKISYCLARRGPEYVPMVDFVDSDIDGVIALFSDFNSGTHGAAGKFPLSELTVLKTRVEKAIQFLHRLVR